ncbi:protein trichome birefringence-like 13 isoform X2 [Cajanus cajan]|uniref:protein trichome birefringence-like 13 isoform X2 n=1 Tax=Cajanus cajan TaxID=3821 RepID=UPI00098DD3F0|nr:protein trichome birefringence-like 13 isoform X2 [Cajanus cajan]
MDPPPRQNPLLPPHLQGDLQGLELPQRQQIQRRSPRHVALAAPPLRSPPIRPPSLPPRSRPLHHWNMFVSLFCALKAASDGHVKKWRPAGADRGFTFLTYNLTIAYHRTNLLARYGRWSATDDGGALETLGFREGFRVDVDVPESTWAQALSFHDILIFNTGHWWWAPSKFDPTKSPMLFFKKGQPVIPPLRPDQGLDMVLKHMIPYVEENARPGAVKFFRTQSPRHFEGGDWDQGGSCQRDRPLAVEQVEELFSVKNNGTNVEARLVNEHLYKALKGSSFIILDITHLSEFRADAHPASAGGKKHDDCMHWCLPGITDTWNDLFIELLNRKIKGRS